MKKRVLMFAFALGFAALCIPVALAQVPSAVKGIAKDEQGNPIAGATVQMVRTETGRKYSLKTDKKGEFMSIGIDAPGTYQVELVNKDGQVLYKYDKFSIKASSEPNDNFINFDLQKIRQEQTASMTEEQKKQAAQVEAAQKENVKIKGLNELLAKANAAIQAGAQNPASYQEAITLMQQATQQDPNRDVIWGTLAEAERLSAAKAADQATRQKLYADSVQSYKKAIELKQANPKGSNANIAAYYNNLGEAYAKSGQTQDAVGAYQSAAQADPAAAGMYYYNLGAVLVNTGKPDDAIQAFDKAIAADPNKADAYYQKGVVLLSKAKLEGDKMVAPPGTAEALNKYLELQPTGQYADAAKQLLASIGAKVETNYGTRKKK